METFEKHTSRMAAGGREIFTFHFINCGFLEFVP